MPALVSPAASALADIGHLLESVERPSQQLSRALALVGRVVPYDRCALLDASSAASPDLLVVPPAATEEQGALTARLSALHELVSDRPPDQSGPVQVPGKTRGVEQLAFPLVAVDEVTGILMVERAGAGYDEQHLQLLAVVATQLAGYLANVRLRREQERAMRAMQRASDLLEHIRDGFLELDSAWTCVRANQAAGELLGIGHDGLVGADVRFLVGLGREPPFVAACERALREGAPVHVEAEQYGARPRWLELELYPTELGLSVFLRDVSEQKATQQLRDVVMGILGHDLRTPLGAITITAATLLRRGGLDPATERAIGRIASSGARMAELVAKLLDLTRIRFGEGLPIERRPTDLAAVCREVTSETAAAHPGREIHCEAAGNLDGRWDGARLAQAVTNLLSNALQHGDPRAPVRLTAGEASDGGVEVAVHNHGTPIPPELVRSIFEPFRQVDEKDRRRGGIGLGLFIADSVVRAHGGRIDVESTAEAGTTFTVRLPRH